MINKILIKLSALFFIIFFYIFSYIMKKEKGLYIFGGMSGKNVSGNSKAMFEFYKNKKKCFYITKNKNLIGKNIIFINSIKTFFKILKAEYIFLDSGASAIIPSVALLGNFKIVKLWHGDAIKKINFDSKNYIKSIGKIGRFLLKNEYKNNIIIPVGNEANKKIMNSAFLGNKAEITGLPRNDIFFKENKKELIEKINKNFEIKKYKKIFLYTPTWRDTNSKINPFSEKFLEKINKYFKEKNYLFIISGHLQTKEIIFSEKTNIKEFKNNDIETQELLVIADILITDYSSIYIDFLLTNKPIIFYAYDIKNYLNKDRELYFNYESVIIKETLAKKEEDFFQKIQNIDKIILEKKYINNYKKIKDFFHKYQKGGYSKKVSKFINK